MPGKRTLIDNAIGFIVVIGASLFLVLLHFGPGVLSVSNFGWLMQYDWAEHFLGWHFFRYEPWTFPPGAVNNYFYPVGTTIGYTDSIPLFAFVFKIFHPFLPQWFQYFGLWFLLNYLITGFMAFCFAKKLRVNYPTRIIIVLFFIFTPLLTFKAMHPALCGQWVILGSLLNYIYVKDLKKSLINQMSLLALSALIHPYLAVMVWGLTFALIMRQGVVTKELNPAGTIVMTVLSLGLTALIWFLVGYFTVGTGQDMAAGGYGWFSLNLNAPFNTNGFAQLGPEFPLKFGQKFEGFNYPGLAILILWFLSLMVFIVRPSLSVKQLVRKPLFWLPLMIMLAGMTLFAISNVVTFNQYVLFKIDLSRTVELVVAPFRASARFFWPVYYLLMIGAFVLLVKVIRREVLLISILTGALVIQVVDIYPIIAPAGIEKKEYNTPLDEDRWSDILEHTDKIVLYPPFGKSYLFDDDYRYFARMAALHNIPFTAGYVSRADSALMRTYRKQLDESLNTGEPDSLALFVTTGEHVERFRSLVEKGSLKSAMINGYYLFLPDDNRYAFHDEDMIPAGFWQLIKDTEEMDYYDVAGRLESVIRDDSLRMRRILSAHVVSADSVVDAEVHKAMHLYFPDITLDHYIQQIKSSPEWLATVKRKAREQGLALEYMLKKDAEYVYFLEMEKILRKQEEEKR